MAFLTFLTQSISYSESTRKDGTPVGTPMWFAVVEHIIILRTEADSPKVKRIRRQSIVKVASCTIRGIPIGGYIECVAGIVPQERELQAEAALRRKYGLRRRLFNVLVSNDYVYLELTPLETRTGSLQAGSFRGREACETPPDAA